MIRTNCFGLALLAWAATVLALGAVLCSKEIGPIRSPSDLRVAVQYAQACEKLAEVELATAEHLQKEYESVRDARKP